MSLPNGFVFSQESLQDYVECPRRLQLRRVLMQPWPALITASAADTEQHVARGVRFHHLVRQHVLGLPEELLAPPLEEADLRRWWHAYRSTPPADLPTHSRRAEVVLSAPLRQFRLVAKCDLVAVDPGERMVIVDWKTALRVPSRTALEARMQTRAYRYLAVEAGAGVNGGTPVLAEHVEMVYWFANRGGTVERFPYDSIQLAGDRSELSRLVDEIARREESIWPLTEDEHRCRFCSYRSFCDRNVKPGLLEELDDDLEVAEIEIDLEQIAEIDF